MQTITRNLCRVAFDLAIASSCDPINAFLPDLHLRTTTIYSPWFTRSCPACRQKFREGDRVRLCPGVEGKPCGQAYHDDGQYNLRCWDAHFRDGNVCKKKGFDRFAGRHVDGCGFTWAGTLPDRDPPTRLAAGRSPRNGTLVRQFEAGLKSTWRAFGEREVLLAVAGDPFIGHNCPWCRFQIREGDHIVKCPCAICFTYFHDDIYRHMECWNQWNGSRGLHFCPTTGSKIPADKMQGVAERRP
jgi:hypothetical protein